MGRKGFYAEFLDRVGNNLTVFWSGAHILIKFGGGELDCGTDFPMGVRATFLGGEGQRAYCPILRGPNLTRCHHSLRRARKF